MALLIYAGRVPQVHLAGLRVTSSAEDRVVERQYGGSKGEISNIHHLRVQARRPSLSLGALQGMIVKSRTFQVLSYIFRSSHKKLGEGL